MWHSYFCVHFVFHLNQRKCEERHCFYSGLQEEGAGHVEVAFTFTGLLTVFQWSMGKSELFFDLHLMCHSTYISDTVFRKIFLCIVLRGFCVGLFFSCNLCFFKHNSYIEDKSSCPCAHLIVRPSVHLLYFIFGFCCRLGG